MEHKSIKPINHIITIENHKWVYWKLFTTYWKFLIGLLTKNMSFNFFFDKGLWKSRDHSCDTLFFCLRRALTCSTWFLLLDIRIECWLLVPLDRGSLKKWVLIHLQKMSSWLFLNFFIYLFTSKVLVEFSPFLFDGVVIFLLVKVLILSSDIENLEMCFYVCLFKIKCHNFV